MVGVLWGSVLSLGRADLNKKEFVDGNGGKKATVKVMQPWASVTES